MNHVGTLLNMACGHSLLESEDSRARRLQIVATALLASLFFAAIFGIAAGGRHVELALANIYKVPMVILLSAVSAVPAGMLTWKLTGAPGRGTDLLLRFASGVFGGTLVLAALAPFIALYYHSSAWAGPMLGIGTVGVALASGCVIFVRGVLRAGGRTPVLPVVVFITLQLASMFQLIALASPILPERNVFSGGIDRLGTVHAPHAAESSSDEVGR